MTERTKPDVEVFKINLNARGLMEAGSILRQRCVKKFQSPDFSAMKPGLDLPADFLQIGSRQPTLAELTVLANKLDMQVILTHVELKPLVSGGFIKGDI